MQDPYDFLKQDTKLIRGVSVEMKRKERENEWDFTCMFGKIKHEMWTHVLGSYEKTVESLAEGLCRCGLMVEMGMVSGHC